MIFSNPIGGNGDWFSSRQARWISSTPSTSASSGRPSIYVFTTRWRPTTAPPRSPGGWFSTSWCQLSSGHCGRWSSRASTGRT